MAATYELNPMRRGFNRAIRPLIRLGVVPGTYLLVHRGRRSGREYSTPVTLIQDVRGRFLVAPYGERAWVKNVRAAGEAELRRGGRAERLRVTELPPEEAAPILRDYARKTAVATRWFFDTRPSDGQEAWIEEARSHPVFRLDA